MNVNFMIQIVFFFFINLKDKFYKKICNNGFINALLFHEALIKSYMIKLNIYLVTQIDHMLSTFKNYCIYKIFIGFNEK
jgi:hypothetical protein